MNGKIAKNWLKMIIRRFYGTINIAEKNYFRFDFSAAPLIFKFLFIWFWNYLMNYFQVKKFDLCHFAQKMGKMDKKIDNLAYFVFFLFQTLSHKSANFQNFSKWLKCVVSSIDTSRISHNEKFSSWQHSKCMKTAWFLQKMALKIRPHTTCSYSQIYKL